jgi:hypothetical protein
VNQDRSLLPEPVVMVHYFMGFQLYCEDSSLKVEKPLKLFFLSQERYNVAITP